jgi:hypothetical protein
MKRLLTTFLVASLLITTTLSFSSCKKADTNSTENLDSDEWIPTVVNVITPDDLNSRDFTDPISCPYYPSHCQLPLYYCNHGYEMWPYGPFCNEHYHAHTFNATDDCTPDILNIPGYWSCQYMGVRKHVHIVSYTRFLWHIDTHTGGGAWGNE